MRFRHCAWVRSVDFSPDGKRLASLTYSSRGDEGLFIWDTRTGKVEEHIPDLEGYSVAWSPDGNSLLIATRSKSAVIHDLVSGERRKLKGKGRGLDVAWSEDGRSVFLGSRSGVTKYRARDAKPLLRWSGRGDSISVASGRLAVASPYVKKSDSFRLYDIESGKRIKSVSPEAKFRDVSLSSDGKYIAIAPRRRRGRKAVVSVREVKGGKRVCRVRVKNDCIGRIAFLKGTHQLVILSGAGVVRRVDVETGKELVRIDGPRLARDALAVSDNGKYVATAGHTRRLGVWDLQTGKRLRPDIGHGHRITALAFARDGTLLASAGYDQTIRLWDVRESRLRHILRGHDDDIRAIAWSDDGRHLASVQHRDENKAFLWDARKGTRLHRFRNTPARATDLAFRGNGRVVIAGRRGQVHMWDVHARKETESTQIKPSAVRRRRRLYRPVALSKDGSKFAAFDRVDLQVIDLKSGTSYRIARAVSAKRRARDCVLSDGGYLAAWEQGGWIRVMETVSGQLIMRLQTDAEGSVEISFSGGGRFLACGSSERSGAVVYDLHTKQQVARFPASKRQYPALSGHGTRALCFSGDGSLLATGAEDGTILVWDVSDCNRAAEARGGFQDPAECWRGFASHDVSRAYSAWCGLNAQGGQAVAYLAKVMAPVRKPDAVELGELFRQLDSEDYQVRRKAYARLACLGSSVSDSLQQAQKTNTSLAASRRLRRLVKVMAGSRWKSPAVLQQLRAVHALRVIGTAQARTLLESLADGVKGAPQTRAARQSLRSLGPKARPDRDE
jgi:WD40 repeat protein